MDPSHVPDHSVPEIWKFIVDVATAIGTLLIAVLAVWGDSLKNLIFAPKMKLELRSKIGQYAKIEGVGTLFFHLRLTNLGRFAVPDCQVLLTGYSREDASKKLVEEDLVMPLQLPWAPNLPILATARERNLVRQLTIDFLRLREGADKIELRVYDSLGSVDIDVHKDQKKIRYRVSVESPGVKSLERFFEVSWDGTWSAMPQQLIPSLVIDEVSSLT